VSNYIYPCIADIPSGPRPGSKVGLGGGGGTNGSLVSNYIYPCIADVPSGPRPGSKVGPGGGGGTNGSLVSDCVLPLHSGRTFWAKARRSRG